MKIGSHDTMSYLMPHKWYMIPFMFCARCQSKNYKQQYECGARWFDLRLKTTEILNDEPIIAHGFLNYKTYKGFVDEFLTFLNNKAENETIYVRLIYEMPSKDKSKNAQLKENNFIELCKTLQTKYSNIHFTSARRKYDWKVLTELEEEPCLFNLYSSMTWLKLDDWCPWLYAFFMNKRNLKKYKNYESNCFLLMDFLK